MPQTIQPGSQSTTFTIGSADTYTLAAGSARTQTASTAIQATVASGATTIDIEGTLTDTVSGQRAIRAALGNGQILVGTNGIVRALDGDAIQAQAFTGANAAVSTVNLINLGQILSATSITAIGTTGATPPSAAYALNYNAAVGATNAPASDFTSGGVITNGSEGNATALIRSDSGDAIRLGAHQTLVNYGTITGAGPVNDSSSNNSFNATGNTSNAQRYDISRGVRINAATATNDTIDNHGLIQGAQHGVDVGNTAATNIQVVNQAGATILGHNGSGVGADTTGAAAGTVVVTNSGTIRGEYAPTYDRAGYATIDGDGDGVDVDGGATVYNLAGGLIAGAGAGGVLNGQGAGGFDSNGRANRSEGLSLGGGVVVNDGTISGADTAIVVNNDSNSNGSRSGVAATSIVNGATGAIVGQNGYAIRLENKTGTAAIDNDTIVNAGTITGNGGVPIGTVLRQDGNADPGTVGTLNGVAYTTADTGSARFIAGDGAAIQTGEGRDALSNYGTITGNTGRAISLEGGDDTLNLYTGATVTGRIDGGAGTDILNLRLDDRTGAGPNNLGANSGVTTGTLAAIVGFEALNVQGGTWTLADAQSYASGIAVTSGAGLVVGASGSIVGAVANAGTLTFAHASDLVQADVISGAGSVVQAGSGVLVLSGASTYSGGTTLVSGILDLAAATTGSFGAVTAAAAGTGAIRFTDGAQTLRIEGVALGSDAGFANTIAGFAADGDVINLRGIGQTSTAMFDYESNVLTLADALGTRATLHFTGSYAGAQFSAASDGAGGTQVTLSLPTLTVTAALASDTGVSGTDSLTTDPTVTGTADASALVTFSENGTVLGSVTADAQGHYTFGFRDGSGTALLADGAHAITVTETTLGATVAAVQPVRLILDTAAPSLQADAAAGTGVVTTLTGNVLANDSDASGLHVVSLQFASTPSVAVPEAGTTQVDSTNGTLMIAADGSYSYHPTTAGQAMFIETVADAAGNTSQTTLTLDVAKAAIPAALSFGFALTDAHFDFSSGHDLVTAPNGMVTDLTGVATISFTDGTVKGNDGSPLIDDLFYAATNLDVWRAHVDPDQHYADFGWHEGRDPNAEFSTTGYLAANADVAKAAINPLTHYDQFGWKEGRDPAANFDNELYLSHNPDVKAAGVDPLTHYLTFGQAEGRQAYAAVGKAGDLGTHPGFDAEYYLLSNTDVAKAAITAGGDGFVFAYTHYETFGWHEGRNPNAVFDTKGYLNAYADVKGANVDPLTHYDTFGFKEGRDPSASFDTKMYETAYADVANAHVDPMLHYLQFGALEGRSAFADGKFG
ncbi:hypothetical protein AFCDBAGC_1284 [Methylobacterium cerastii]|uniref:Autotransporter domain-containing protein n=1 Tax=Methylobacterium cerastii TaxID=932741 RepID=A0ABQ4QEU7_9HYPH|nr:Ig-like domain-containing protein [Methylobacterium cerastii]GJD43432.1 hypothetical protein AFCDBAGC_1284 [Methylobacterium cerastii]